MGCGASSPAVSGDKHRPTGSLPSRGLRRDDGNGGGGFSETKNVQQPGGGSGGGAGAAPVPRDATAAAVGSHEHKDAPAADVAVPAPSAPSSNFSGGRTTSQSQANLERQDPSASGKSPTPPVSIPGRGSEHTSGGGHVDLSTAAAASPPRFGTSSPRNSHRKSMTRDSLSPAANDNGNPLARTSLTGKMGDYLRRQSTEGVHGSLDAVRKAGHVLTQKAHGDDKESTSNHATASIDPAMYY